MLAKKACLRASAEPSAGSSESRCAEEGSPPLEDVSAMTGSVSASTAPPPADAAGAAACEAPAPASAAAVLAARLRKSPFSMQPR